jgi:hypothetical protein
MPVDFNWTTCRCIPEDRNLNATINFFRRAFARGASWLFHKINKFHENSFSGSGAVTCGQIDRAIFGTFLYKRIGNCIKNNKRVKIHTIHINNPIVLNATEPVKLN